MTAASLLAGYSRSEIVLSLVFACVFAWLGYRMSHRHRLARGVTPWRLPSGVWAVICFFLQPFGIIVELFAQATTKPTVPSGAGQAVSSAFPAYPQRARVEADPRARVEADPAAVLVEPAPETPTGPPPPAADGTGKSPLFGWYPDTTHRHQLRYWDGRRWSELVSDDGVQGTDPV
jgi:hypothetical protein